MIMEIGIIDRTILKARGAVCVCVCVVPIQFRNKEKFWGLLDGKRRLHAARSKRTSFQRASNVHRQGGGRHHRIGSN